MTRTQIYFGEEFAQLKSLAASRKQTCSALIRQAVRNYVQRESPQNWKDCLMQAAGLWKDRPHMDRLAKQLRVESEARLERLWRKT